MKVNMKLVEDAFCEHCHLIATGKCEKGHPAKEWIGWVDGISWCRWCIEANGNTPIFPKKKKRLK